MTRLPTRQADRLHLEVQQIRTAAEIFRAMPKYAAPSDFASSLHRDAGRLLGDDEELN